MIATKAIGIANALDYFNALPDVAEDAAVFAINDIVDGTGLVMVRKEMRKQIDFPAGYLEGDRLKVGRRATKGVLEGTIRGRDRATSLARFAGGQNADNTRGRGVRVTVKKGQTKVMRKAFILNLRNGNQGVGIRLKPGETPHASQKAVRLSNQGGHKDSNLWLLYGPSVDQVFRGVADDVAPELGRVLTTRFLHHFTRLSRRG